MKVIIEYHTSKWPYVKSEHKQAVLGPEWASWTPSGGDVVDRIVIEPDQGIVVSATETHNHTTQDIRDDCPLCVKLYPQYLHMEAQ